MVDTTLQQLIYGQPIVRDSSVGEATILALTDQLTPETLATLRQRVPLTPFSAAFDNDDVLATQAVGLVTRASDAIVRDEGNEYLLARTYLQKKQTPIYQYIIIPGTVLYRLGADIQPLIQLIDDPLPLYNITGAPADAIPVPAPATWTLDKGVSLLETLLETSVQDDIRLLLAVLGAALSARGALIRNFAPDWRERLALVRGLTLLLPAPARPHLTFLTHTDRLDVSLPRLIFSNAETSSERWQIDWAAPQIPDELLQMRYVAHLYSLWNNNLTALTETVRALDSIATNVMPGKTLDAGLAAVVKRHEQDFAVMKGERLPANEVINILTGNMPPTGDTRFHYVEHLLRQALHERDTDAAELVARELDNDPQLDERLWGVFEQVLEEQPDAVYVFVRTRLSEGMDKRWLHRLRQAAQQSLAVAIESGDPDTLSSWLTLISREPSRYELGDVLREGIVEARERAADSPALARDLLTLAVKKQPETLDTLLADEAVVSSLSETAQNALIAQQPAAIDALASHNRELFLLAVKRAIDTQTTCISATTVQNLWAMHTQQQTATLPPPFRPMTLIRRLADDGTALQESALEALLTTILASNEDEAFLALAPALAARDALAPVLVDVLERSGRGVKAILDMVTTLSGNDRLDPQEAIDIYIALLSSMAWSDDTLPLVEQLARVLNQYPDTDVDAAIVWRIAELAAEDKNEQMLRLATRRLLIELETSKLEENLVPDVRRLYKAVQGSQAATTMFLKWWRGYARSQPLAHLQKIDRMLTKDRSVEALQSIVQTAVALRRVLGQRTLPEFAQDISTAYTILQALAEGFDPDERTASVIDGATMRHALEQRLAELPADERHVLATNLKELAQLMTSMSDKRSKPNIIRSDDTIERQLVTGEQPPQSAIDVMRWLSGYLDGVQKTD